MSRYRDVPDDLVYRLFYPAPVYVVSAASGKDEDALSAVWITPVSLKPPRVGVAISPERYSYALVRKSKAFAINKLPFRYVQQMAFIGDVSKRYLHNKLDLSGLHIAAGRTSGVRVIREADAVAECSLVSCLEAGDHDILVGEVKAAYASHEFDTIWDVGRHSYASYVGSVGDGETSRRIFVSADGKLEETRSPRNDAVARRNRDHRSVEEAGFAVKGMEFHEAVKAIAAKTGIRQKDILSILEEMRRQGLVQLGGRLAASDFE
jgi:flavin reductase (DIM6/NTAB) family NADH-FMN oxidoreductase RutF